MSWNSLGISKAIQNQLISVGISVPNQVQVSCIPEILKNKDGVIISKTGTGKTACYVIPMLHQLSKDKFGIFGLVLSPTRELAIQISEQFKLFGSVIGIRVLTCIGGESQAIQGNQVGNKPHIIVATPGRLRSILMDPKNVNSFNKIKCLILDEADMLLGDEEMAKDVMIIINHLPPIKSFQKLALSATSSSMLNTLFSTEDSNNDKIFFYKKYQENTTADLLEQFYLVSPPVAKDANIVSILQKYMGIEELKITKSFEEHTKSKSRNNGVSKQSIIFTSSCWNCQVLALLLRKLSFKVSILHSAMPQSKRKKSYDLFKSNITNLLVCTDLVSRGLDLPNVHLVINDSLPIKTENYIHRVGRTGRANRTGNSVTVITAKDIERLKKVENEIGVEMKEYLLVDQDYVIKLTKSIAVMRRIITIDLKNNIEIHDNQSSFSKKMLSSRKRL